MAFDVHYHVPTEARLGGGSRSRVPMELGSRDTRRYHTHSSLTLLICVFSHSLGVPLTLGATTTNSRLTTPTLNLTAVNVVSNETNYLTDNYWDAFVGTRSDVLPEVPNDGYIELRASSNMKLSALRDSIKVQDDIRNTAVDVQVEVEECSTGPEMPCIDVSIHLIPLLATQPVCLCSVT